MFPSNINDYNKHHVKKGPLISRSKKVATSQQLNYSISIYKHIMENYRFTWLLFCFFSIHPFIILFCGSVNVIFLSMGLCGKYNCLALSGMVYVRSLVLSWITRRGSLQMCAAASPTLLTF